MHKVLYVTDLSVPYKIVFLNMLAAKVDLQVFFCSIREERNEEWLSSTCHFSRKWFEPRMRWCADGYSTELIREVRKKCDEGYLPIIDGYSSLAFILLIRQLQKTGIRYWLHCDGIVPRESESRVKLHLKRQLIGRARYVFSSSRGTDLILGRYGVPQDHILRYNFTSLERKDILQKPLSFEEKADLRSKLHLGKEKVVLYVGRMIPLKGLSTLLEACASIAGEYPFTLVLVGGKAPTFVKKQLSSPSRFALKFIDFVQPENLASYYDASHVFVLPTKHDTWGLVVNEALARGVPVVSTEKCVSANELLDGEEVGRRVPVGNASLLGNAILHYLRLPDEAYQSVQAKCLNRIRDYTYEYEVEQYYEAIEKHDAQLPDPSPMGEGSGGDGH